ncbi:MAG: hypothetical protein JWM38_550 [Sphingomonas bacterium]|nr:hypothetical protein [Sphingomonas bacterium]
MSGFVDRLVARGATLGAVPGMVAPQPRPLGRFEDSLGASGASIVDDQGEATAPGAPFVTVASPPAKQNRRASPPASPPERTRDAPAGQPPRPIDAAGPALHPEQMLAPPLHVERTEATAVSLEWTPPPAAGAAPAAPAEAPAAALTQIIERIFETPAAEAVAGKPEVQIIGPIAAPAAPAPLPMVAGTTGASPPPVSVSVGRIEVQFVQPEPRAPARSAAPPRTRGFSAYARARRGEPR